MPLIGGEVIAWKQALAGLTSVELKNIPGKAVGEHSIFFFGHKVPMLTDMIFHNGTTIQRYGYTIIGKGERTVSAWTKKPEKWQRRVLLMKVAALHNGKGFFQIYWERVGYP
jgi:hypothetical protein